MADGRRALEAARARAPDLVLADVMMPGLDGFDPLRTLRTLRADERLGTVPVILLSARAGEEARLEGLQAGADDYLVKPFSGRELLSRVDSHIRLQRVRREAAEALRASREDGTACPESLPDIACTDAPRRRAPPKPRVIPERSSRGAISFSDPMLTRRQANMRADGNDRRLVLSALHAAPRNPR